MKSDKVVRSGQLKRKLDKLLNPVGNDLGHNRSFEIFSICLIVLNVLAVVLETTNWFHQRYAQFFHAFEVFSVAVFTLEYIGRIWTADLTIDYRNSRHPRLRYIFSFMAAVDLLSILPFYLPMVFTFDLRMLRSIRLLRIFRIFKIGHYSEDLKMFTRVFHAKRGELFITGFAGTILLLVASSVMYFVENQAQPHVFDSIPHAMWWGIATLTTVGYGDVYPVTTAGRFLTGIISVLGIGLFALPAGILGAGFYEEVSNRRKALRKCPHCGMPLNKDTEPTKGDQ